ncbi:MAG: hypothetical protein U0556_05940 [Dehalococcoidia bacterium]
MVAWSPQAIRFCLAVILAGLLPVFTPPPAAACSTPSFARFEEGVLTVEGTATLGVDEAGELRLRQDVEEVSVCSLAGVDDLRAIEHIGGKLTLEGLALAGPLTVSSDAEVLVSAPLSARRLDLSAQRLAVRTALSAPSIRLSAADTLNLAPRSHLSADDGRDGGVVDLAAPFVNAGGMISARGKAGGLIRLQGDTIQQGGTIDAGGDRGGEALIRARLRYLAIEASAILADDDGRVTIDAEAFFSSGRIEASGERGGTIHLLGGEIALDGARVVADGVLGGGEILIGGDYQGANPAIRNARETSLGVATLVSASALDAGDGGRVIVWADGTTEASATILARGGALAGNGGFVEVSGKLDLVAAVEPDVSAPAGEPGRVLFDPKNITNSSGAFPKFELGRTVSANANFGQHIVPLSNGNAVITAPGHDTVGDNNRGAVFLFDAVTGALQSTLTGQTDEDQVGSGGVLTLTVGDNIVILSPAWTQPSGTGCPCGAAGAWTWLQGNSTVTDIVDATNSAVGNSLLAALNASATRLPNGKWVLAMPNWRTAADSSVGAACLMSGTAASPVGVPIAADCLTGNTSGDGVGFGGVTPMLGDSSSGKYVVGNPNWDNGGASQRGAATWCDGSGVNNGCAGKTNTSAVTAGFRKLLGVSADDQVGSEVVALANGKYVVVSKDSDAGGVDAGAVTLGSENGQEGTVTLGTSTTIVGQFAGDKIGSGGVVPLSDGARYVIKSPLWNSGRGAVTACNGQGGGNSCGFDLSPRVAVTNSLTGIGTTDSIGERLVALTNDSYLVGSPSYDQGGEADRGAIRWCTPLSGGTYGSCAGVQVSNGTSLVGQEPGDRAGDLLFALPNGHGVAVSRLFDFLGDANRGAVTWINGNTGKAPNNASTGQLGSTNSLVGAATGDQAGSGGILILSDGNFVIFSPEWGSGGAADFGKGAATWVNGATGAIGTIDATNSFLGAAIGDEVGSGQNIALPNGAYAFASPTANASNPDAGLVTRLSGGGPLTGTVSNANSFFGQLNNRVGSGGLKTIDGDDFVVLSPNVPSGCTATFHDGGTGRGVASGGFLLVTNDSVLAPAATTTCSVTPNPHNGAYFIRFNTNGGQVFVATADLNRLSFKFGVANNVNAENSLGTRILQKGIPLTLQASNDIVMANVVQVNNPSGNGGHLTLQAGRSVTISQNINTDGGDLFVTANETTGNGVVSAQRDPGTAVISQTGGSIVASFIRLRVRSPGSGPAGEVRTQRLSGVSLNVPFDSARVAHGGTLSFTGGVNIFAPVHLTSSSTITAGTLSLSSLVLNGFGLTLIGPNLTMPSLVLSPTETITSVGGLVFPSGQALSGAGRVIGPVTISGGLSPGTSPGLLSTGNLTLTATSVYTVEIDGPAPSQFDSIAVTGTVALQGGSLVVAKNPAYTPNPGDRFRIVDNDGTDPVAGTFASLADGTTIVSNGTTFVIRYNATPNNDVALVVPAPPVATTNAASGVGQTSATLSGLIDPRYLSTAVSFEWGTSADALTNVLASLPATVDGLTPVAVNGILTGLAPGTTVFYRVKAASTGGTVTGGVQSFTTSSGGPVVPPPTVTTGGTSGVGATSATLQGTVNANGNTASVVFDYGTTSGAYTNSIAGTPGSATGATDTAVSAILINLLPNTTYFYRVRAANGGGTSLGSERSFTTPDTGGAAAPTAATAGATDVAQTSATLNGTANANGVETALVFDVGTTSGIYDQTVTATPATLSSSDDSSLTAALSGLQPNRTYFFRARATSAGGTAIGEERSFTTPASPTLQPVYVAIAEVVR